jgi:hypothetical protein
VNSDANKIRTKADFDPYHKWLGIPTAGKPPTHYRLLGLQPFESDPEVISGAVMRQTAHLKTYQLGQHAGLTQKLLTEVSAAKVCLLLWPPRGSRVMPSWRKRRRWNGLNEH